jgi:putative ABC transport system ATP-binding protein
MESPVSVVLESAKDLLMPNPVIAAHDVSVVFHNGSRQFIALDRVSAQFHAGEVVLLMGASGSGKTTLLSLLGCLRSPDAGCVELLGEDLAGARERHLVELRRRRIGFVFQSFRLFPAINALENVLMPAQIDAALGTTRAEALDLLESVGMGDKADLFPNQMSGGERQRVAVARALAKKPVVILCDEPTASLDSVAGAQVAALLQTAAKQRGCTAIIATHDPRLLPVADRTLAMQDGRIVDPGDHS